MECYAIIKLQKEGIHYYSKAKGKESFLKYPHRHIFYITIEIEQFHNDRDIEYVNFKRWIEKRISSNLKEKSCEMLAEKIIDIIHKKYKNRQIKVKVLEDNENGAVVSSPLFFKSNRKENKSKNKKEE